MNKYSHLENLFTEEYIYNVNNSSSTDVSSNPVKDEPQSEKVLEEPISKFDEDAIYLFLDYQISDEEKQFLAKVLSAIKLDLANCIISEWNKEAKEFNGKSFVFSQHISTCEITANRISGPSLTHISQNVELKKALWENMQKLFM